MRIFTEQIFESGVSGTGAVYTSVDSYDLLGQADKFSIQARVTQVSGTSPTLQVLIEQSADGATWGAVSVPINAVSLTAGVVNNLFGSEVGSTATGRLIRMRVVLGGTTPSAFVELYVTGRAKRPSGGA